MVGTIVTVLALRETSASSEHENESSGSSGSSDGVAGDSNELAQGWSLDLVLDDGTVWRGVPSSYLQTQDPRTPRGVPPPPVLQRSFTAVTTQKRPVTEGGWEFDKPRERMMNADELVEANARLQAACQLDDEDDDDDEGSGSGIVIPEEGRSEIGVVEDADVDMKGAHEDDDVDDEVDDDGEQEEEKESASALGSAEVDAAAASYPLPLPFPRLTARLLLRRPRLDGCPGRHALALFQTPNPSFSCDACGQGGIATGDDMYGCV